MYQSGFTRETGKPAYKVSLRCSSVELDAREGKMPIHSGDLKDPLKNQSLELTAKLYVSYYKKNSGSSLRS